MPRVQKEVACSTVVQPNNAEKLSEGTLYQVTISNLHEGLGSEQSRLINALVAHLAAGAPAASLIDHHLQ